MSKKRIGRFTIADITLKESGGLLKQALARMHFVLLGVGVHAESMPSLSTFNTEYTGTSPHFKEVEEGEPIPEYWFDFSWDKDGCLKDAEFRPKQRLAPVVSPRAETPENIAFTKERNGWVTVRDEKGVVGRSQGVEAHILLAILEKLEEIRCGLIDVETAAGKGSPKLPA